MVALLRRSLRQVGAARPFPLAQMDKRLQRGARLDATNVQITCCDGDRRKPFGLARRPRAHSDPSTCVSFESEEGAPKENFVLR